MKQKTFIPRLCMVVLSVLLLFICSNTLAQPPGYHPPLLPPPSAAVNTGRACITILIQPQEAIAAGAAWRFDSEPENTWSTSVSRELMVTDNQPMTIVYKEMPGWVTPASSTVRWHVYTMAEIHRTMTSRIPEMSEEQRMRIVAMMQKACPIQTAEASYTRRVGALTVTVQPQEAVAAGAQWTVSAGAYASPWQNSGATVSSIREGSGQVRFKSLNDARWIIPEPISVNIVTGQTAQASAAYHLKTGSLSALISPPELRESGGQWRIPTLDGGAGWRNSGVYQDVPPGQHNIEFKPVNGWVTPAAQNVNVNSLQRLQVNGEYRRETGSIQVTIQPEGWVQSNARWRFAGQGWHNSGETVSGLSPGVREIEFYDIGVDWVKPRNQSVTIVANQTASATGIFQGVSGMLNVTIQPIEAIQAGAKWRAGNRPWMSSGESDRVPVGQQQVELNTIPGWTADPPSMINILPGQVNRATATFRRGTGSLMITIQPAGAVQAGAQWRVDGGPWQNSGSTLPNITAGSRNVEYKEIPGWARLAAESAVVNPGQTTSLVKNYTEQPGSLQVTIIGSGGDFTGMWQVDNMGWRASNAVLNNITPGPKRIEFNEVPGWIKPNPMDVTVISGQLQRASATYTRSTGLLRVIIQPGNVEAAGAQWRIDGGPWQPSRQLLSNVAVGAHQVEYSDVAGWVKPPPTPINIIGGQSNQITGTYQRR